MRVDGMIVPDDWLAALGRVDASRRILVLGAADVGKSSFIRAALARNRDLRLLDLDPGQKMAGPPGTVALTGPGAIAVERFIFTGSTSASTLRALTTAASTLTGAAGGPVIANTSGFVRGLGARLQSLTIAAIRPDLIVAIEGELELEPILSPLTNIPVVRISPSPLARRKTAAERRRLRQAAFDAALAGAQKLALPGETAFAPAPPIPLTGPQRPVCALADGSGEDMSVGILEELSPDGTHILAPPPSRGVALIRLGRMWAEPAGQGWKLLERRSPSWHLPL